MREFIRLIVKLSLCIFAMGLSADAGQYRHDPSFHPKVDGGKVLAIRSKNDGTTLLVTTTGVQRLLASGKKDKSWLLSSAFGSQRPTKAKIVADNDFIYVSGDFTEFLGVPRSGFVRLKDDGTVDETFPNVLDAGAVVEDFIVLPDGKVILTGKFFARYTREGQAFLIQHLIRLNSDGQIDQPWTENLPLIVELSTGELVHGYHWPGLSLARDSSTGNVYVGVDKSNDGTLAPSIRLVTPLGSLDPSFAALETAGDAKIVELRWTQADTLMAVMRTASFGDSIQTVDAATGTVVKQGLNSDSALGNTDVIDRIDEIYAVDQGADTTYLLTGAFHTLDLDDGNPHPNPRFMLVVDSELSSAPASKLFGSGVYGISIAEQNFGKLTAVGVRDKSITLAGQLDSYDGAECSRVLRATKLTNSAIYLGETRIETLQNDFLGSQIHIDLSILNGTSKPLPALRFRAFEAEELRYDTKITDISEVGIPEFELKFEQVFPAATDLVVSLPIESFDTSLKTADRNTKGVGRFYELIGVLEQAIGDRWLPVDTLVIARGSDTGDGPFTGRPPSMDRSPSSNDNLNPGGVSIVLASKASTLAPNKSTQITATCRLAGKSPLKIPPDFMRYSASKGSVNKNGTYVAKNVPRNTKVTIKGVFKLNGATYRDSLTIEIK